MKHREESKAEEGHQMGEGESARVCGFRLAKPECYGGALSVTGSLVMRLSEEGKCEIGTERKEEENIGRMGRDERRKLHINNRRAVTHAWSAHLFALCGCLSLPGRLGYVNVEGRLL